MPTACTAVGSINIGDAVCLTDWDAGFSRPKVKRAEATNLATSKTVMGVAESIASGVVQVLVAGEVAKQSVTGLSTGAGTSKIVTTDINNATTSLQPKLVAVDRPNGSEHVVGTCDENGNLAIQPRASRDTSPKHVFNVCAYGAIGDNSTDCAAAIEAAINASGGGASAPAGGTVYFPPGVYYCSRSIDVLRQVALRGADFAGFYSTSQIRFAFGCGFVFHETDTAVAVGKTGLAADSKVEDLAFLATLYATGQWSPPVWSPAHGTYTLGSTVRVANDNRYYWECTQAGSPGSVLPFRDEIEHLSGYANQGKRLGVLVTDGGAIWLCKSSSPIIAFTRIHVRRCYFQDFSNAAVLFYGAKQPDPPPAPKFPWDGSNVNASSCSDCMMSACGVGVHITGNNNANGLRITGNYILTTGSHLPSETGGFGIVNHSFLGSHCDRNDIENSTGRWIYAQPGPAGAANSTYVANYSEGGQPAARLEGLVLGGTLGGGYDPSTFVTGYLGGYWTRMWTKLIGTASGAPIPMVRWDEPSESAFNWRYVDNEVVAFGLGERFVTSPDGQRGWWATGTKSSQNPLRQLTGYSQRQAPEGPHHWRVYQGEFRGNSDNPYYIGYSADSKTDSLVRAGRKGVGGLFLAGDRCEPGSAPSIGEVCTTSGWASPNTWVGGTSYTLSHDDFYRLRSATTVTVSGHTYVCVKAGSSSGTSASSPPSGFATTRTILGSLTDPRPAWRWTADTRRMVGDYGRPSVDPSGTTYYYVVVDVPSYTHPVTKQTYPDVFGMGITGTTEPSSWPTTINAEFTEGGVRWKCVAAITSGVFLADGTTEWQYLGPVPVWTPYGSALLPPAIASLNFTLGDTAGGGQSIVVTGSNLSNGQVDIGGTTQTVTGSTSTTCTFTLQPKTAGTYTLTVTTGGGTATTTFEYWSPAQIASVTAFCDAPDYTDAGSGTWTARVGANWEPGGLGKPAASGGAPSFSGGSGEGLRRSSNRTVADLWHGSGTQEGYFWCLAEPAALASAASQPYNDKGLLGEDTQGVLGLGINSSGFVPFANDGAYRSAPFAPTSGMSTGKLYTVTFYFKSGTVVAGGASDHVGAGTENAVGQTSLGTTSITTTMVLQIGSNYNASAVFQGRILSFFFATTTPTSSESTKLQLWAKQRYDAA